MHCTHSYQKLYNLFYFIYLFITLFIFNSFIYRYSGKHVKQLYVCLLQGNKNSLQYTVLSIITFDKKTSLKTGKYVSEIHS